VISTTQSARKAREPGLGDADAKTLYFTAVTGLYRLRVNVAGIRP